MRLIVYFCLILLSACGGGKSAHSYRIGVDPNWYSLEIPGKENNVTGFSNELLQAVSRSEKLQLTMVMVSWDNLLSGLNEGKYDAVLTPKEPRLFNQNTFDFSDVYLATGPVLVVPIKSPINSLEMLQGKEIAVQRGDPNMGLVEKSPGVLLRIYDSIPQALNDIVSEKIDGALIDILTAEGYVHDLYQNQLKVATPPLTNVGLRLVSLHNQATDLIKKFNQGLAAAKQSGAYDKLAHKWVVAE
jgi:polar amino acid transport system substrate-binding protein